MKLTKRTLLALLLGSCTFAGLSSARAEKPVKVAAAVYGLRSEFMKVWTDWLKEHPEVKNGGVKLTVFDGRYDPNVQNDQFDSIIVQQFDAIIFVPLDIEAGGRTVTKAISAGIPVIGANARANSKVLTSYVGSNDNEGGAIEAQYIVDKLGGKGNVVILEGPIGQSGQVERLKGIMSVLDKHPDIKILERKTANWSRAEALALMENWLTAHPGKIQGVIGENDEMAIGAIQAIKAAGLNVKDFAIVGVDGVKDAIRAAKGGEMVSILQDAKAQAQGAMDIALRAVRGESYQPQSDIWKHYGDKLPWKDGIQKNYDVPWTIITEANADEVMKMVTNK